jgi:hypothetical protein
MLINCLFNVYILIISESEEKESRRKGGVNVQIVEDLHARGKNEAK